MRGKVASLLCTMILLLLSNFARRAEANFPPPSPSELHKVPVLERRALGGDLTATWELVHLYGRKSTGGSALSARWLAHATKLGDPLAPQQLAHIFSTGA